MCLALPSTDLLGLAEVELLVEVVVNLEVAVELEQVEVGLDDIAMV